ncbi:MAG: UvrD-helicase domain-containing protein, partial [Actinobacteria bacterium]|nr:UvrD-helicase domain-containing protein [Actinomycetota bacterium]NIS28798.1 UvrD-helicase domain-containing protein [Actinomycetota bacterium]NIT94164.1 UvrD-helicase domain-containing protein [Actinomycetota bacterium]NIU64242.1 UvrD-helicase domain-containing protein [Actinomycetota bacterium]NIV54284.1 UvrD-helicase domain-containing protein [Actinomycetota bacterium]
ADVAGPQIVVGGPGTGKTEFLVRRAVHLVTRENVAPDRILVLSFGRRGVAGVSDRIRERL